MPDIICDKPTKKYHERWARLPLHYLDRLDLEASLSGAKKPATLLRILLTEKLDAAPSWHSQACKIAVPLLQPVGRSENMVKTRRINVRFSEATDKKLGAILERYYASDFRLMVIGLLETQYFQESPADGGHITVTFTAADAVEAVPKLTLSQASTLLAQKKNNITAAMMDAAVSVLKTSSHGDINLK